MKIPRPLIILVSTVMVALLLTSCSGAMPINSWPGLSAGEGAVYLTFQSGVFAINTGSGAMQWRFPAEASAGQAFYAPPELADDLLVAGDYTSHLYGLNPANGTQVWMFDQEQGQYVGSPLVVNDTVLAPNSNYHLIALDRNGKFLWKFKTGNVVWAKPASDGELVYLSGADHFIYALRLSNGEEVWKRDLGSAVLSTPVILEDTVYVTTLDGLLYALRAGDGEVVWNMEAGENVWSTPVENEGILYFGDSAGTAYAVQTGDAGERVLWEVAIGSPIIGSPALFDEGLVFVTEGGNVQAVDFAGGLLWNQAVNGKLYSTPVVVDDTLVVAVTDGDSLLTAFNLQGGAKWVFNLPK